VFIGTADEINHHPMKDFIKTHRNDDPRQLALQANRYPDIDMRAAVVQISGWQVAKRKLPLWAATEGIVYPEHLSMEQCSSQLTAEYKAQVALKLTEGSETRTLADLTGGFGVDATMMALKMQARLTLVERNPQLCSIARNNLPLLGVEKAEIICADSVETLHNLPHQSLIFIDPARRDEHGGKTVAISDCTPDISAISGLLTDHADWLIVKLSPMLDLASVGRELSGVAQVHIVSVEGECKEVLVVMRKGHESKAQTFCVNISKDGKADIMTADEETTQIQYASQLGRYLYEPHASIMKACAFRSVATQFGVKKLHPDSHLYTSDNIIGNFPGRKFEVESWSTFSKKELKQFLSGIKKANLTVRNFPATVADLRKRLKISEGGDIYLFTTTAYDESHIIIKCKK